MYPSPLPPAVAPRRTLPQDIVIAATAYELPAQRVSSAELEAQLAPTIARLRLPKGQIEGLTGIRERRLWAPGTQPSEAATLAARKVITQAGIDPQRIGCVINASVSRDFLEPSVACLVHGNLRLSPHCLNYDLGNACLGFLDAMVQAMLMLAAGWMDYALVVAGESSREALEATLERLLHPQLTIQEFHQHFATLTLGSGAVAMLLCRRHLAPHGHRINGAVTLADTAHNRLCLGQKDHMVVDPAALLQAGVALARKAWAQAEVQLAAWSDASLDLYVPHQVSTRHVRALARALELTEDKVHLNVQVLGNIGPAALPITLAMAGEAGRLRPGAHVGLMGIGSGLNCTLMSVTW